MKTTQNIAKMALHVKKGNDAIFRLTCKNQKSLFCFFYWQIRVKTIRSFRKIEYTCKTKTILFYMLKFVEIVSLRYYKIIYNPSC